MEFLILNYINISLLLYFTYSLFTIYLISTITKLTFKDTSVVLNLTDDEYFVLNNTYNIKKIFYFITYKLYHNGIISLNSGESRFSISKLNTDNLNKIELEIYNLYKKKFSVKQFDIEMINESIFKEYYNNIYNSLRSKKLIKSRKNLLFVKTSFIFGIFIVLLPGISTIVLFYLKGIILYKIIVGMIINLFFYIVLLKNTILSTLTKKGIEVNISLQNEYSSINNLFKNYNYVNDIDKFLLQNFYMYYMDGDD